MKKVLCAAAIVVIISCCCLASACSDLGDAYDGTPYTDPEAWELTSGTDFTVLDSLDGTIWAPSPHGLRKYEYWCSDMIGFSDEGIVISSAREDDHVCSEGICPKSGVFTSGIETRSGSEKLFEQAFGYFEATVKVPRGSGMWSAFWLQSDNVGNVGHGGKDGAEIDVYESSFIAENRTCTGSAVHVDAYDPPFYASSGAVTDVGKDLYDGEFHTYALLWTPEMYVFYVDGEETWRTDYKDVSTVPEFLRLTVEIRDPEYAVYGPYGQKIGRFENAEDGSNDFVISRVKVYANDDFAPYINSEEDFDDMKGAYIAIYAVCGVVVAALAAGLIAATASYLKKKKRAGR